MAATTATGGRARRRGGRAVVRRPWAYPPGPVRGAVDRAAAPAADAFGRTRGHLWLETTINRRDYQFNWDAPLPNGGSALADDITLTVDISLVAQD